GSYHEKLGVGSIIIADSAARCDGLSKQLVPIEMPAIGDLEMALALEKAVATTNLNYQRGTIVTLDAFYAGPLAFNHELLAQSMALGAEMEIAALYVIAKLRNVKAGGLLVVDGFAHKVALNDYNPAHDLVKEAMDKALLIALQTIIKADLNYG
ncbi:MAG: purine-nucleoside phosphorylase, partial [Bacilli bacterium]